MFELGDVFSRTDGFSLLLTAVTTKDDLLVSYGSDKSVFLNLSNWLSDDFIAPPACES